MNENSTDPQESANSTGYQPPVDQLLTLGEAEAVSHDEWPDYPALGIGRKSFAPFPTSLKSLLTTTTNSTR